MKPFISRIQRMFSAPKTNQQPPRYGPLADAIDKKLLELARKQKSRERKSP